MKPADRRADSRTAVGAALPAWLREDAGGVLLDVHLQPGARRDAVCGVHGERLKIAVAAPPVDGRANEALVEFLARRLDLPRRQLHLVAGQHHRDKTLRVDGIAAGEARRRLATE